MSTSKQEETLAVLYLIAGLIARQSGLAWLAWLCFVAYGVSTVGSIAIAVHNRKAGKKWYE